MSLVMKSFERECLFFGSVVYSTELIGDMLVRVRTFVIDYDALERVFQ